MRSGCRRSGGTKNVASVPRRRGTHAEAPRVRAGTETRTPRPRSNRVITSCPHPSVRSPTISSTELESVEVQRVGQQHHPVDHRIEPDEPTDGVDAGLAFAVPADRCRSRLPRPTGNRRSRAPPEPAAANHASQRRPDTWPRCLFGDADAAQSAACHGTSWRSPVTARAGLSSETSRLASLLRQHRGLTPAA